MTELKFRSEMRRAETMRMQADPVMAEYWAGYIQGLRRSYHGEAFGTEEEHTQCLLLAESRTELSKQRGRGYRDGLAFEAATSRRGRPSVGNSLLRALKVPIDLRQALERKATELGLSVPDARREAYRKFVNL